MKPLLAVPSASALQWQLTMLLLVLPLMIVWMIRSWWKKSRSSLSNNGRQLLPPGPPRLPIVGNLHQVMGKGKLPHRSLHELARRHGPVMLLRLGSVPTVVVTSAEAASEVLRTHDADCCSRPNTPGPRRLSYGHRDVSFAPYSSYWREMRKILTVELFSVRRVKAVWYAREAQVDKLISRLTGAEGEPVYLEDHVFALVDGIIGTVALGSIYGTEQFSHKQHFHEVLDEGMAAKASFTAEDYFPNLIGRLIDRLTGVVAQRERAFKDLDDFYETVIQQHLESSASQAAPGNGRPDLIDAFISHMKEHRGSLRFTKDHIKGLLSNVFGGGVYTSSVTMIWAMAELMKNPTVLKKAQEEVRAVVACSGNDRVQPDDLPKLKYLKMVVKETLRLHPAVPLLTPRETMRDVKICGYDVLAKTRLFVNAWAIGRDPMIWASPEEFNPDRFEGNKIDFNGTQFELLPFGAGRRICPGIAMAVATLEFTLANLLCCFDWALPDGAKLEDLSMEEAPGLTVHRKMPLVLVPTRYKWQR